MNGTEANDLIAFAERVHAPRLVQPTVGQEVVLHQQDETLSSLEPFATYPDRSRGTTTLHSLNHFAALVARLDPEHQAPIFYTREGLFSAILNHDADEPGWRDWRVVYSPQASESWKAWSAADGKSMPQLDTAYFIEERLADFRTPEGAAMLDLAQTFTVHRSGSFVSAQRIADGSTRITMEEENTAKAQISVPPKVNLGMRVFDDREAYSFDSYFRYRIADKRLLFTFKMVNREDVLRLAVGDLAEALAKLLPNNAFYLGLPPPETK